MHSIFSEPVFTRHISRSKFLQAIFPGASYCTPHFLKVEVEVIVLQSLTFLQLVFWVNQRTDACKIFLSNILTFMEIKFYEFTGLPQCSQSSGHCPFYWIRQIIKHWLVIIIVNVVLVCTFGISWLEILFH